MSGWFEVDRQGLSKLLRRRGMQFVLYELVQNAWDTHATRVDVTLVAVPGRPLAELVVEDDDPNGFQDIAHAFTLFAESSRKANPEQRGRFNLGEKLVLAVCEEAVISTTTGTIEFGAEGRTKRRAKRDHGSEFRALLSLTRAEMGEIEHAATLLLPPPTVITTFNARTIEARKPIRELSQILPTEIAGADGVLKRTARKTGIQLYDAIPGEPARIYEMGIPVCELDAKHAGGWDVNVGQKVPLNTDRDSVTAGYRRALHVLVVNEMAALITPEQANAGWVRDAAGDDRADPKAVETVAVTRYGDKFVDYDPTDKEANDRAVANGYVVIPSNALSKQERKHLRDSGKLQLSGQVFPTSRGSKRVSALEGDEVSQGMHAVAEYARRVARATLGIAVEVDFFCEPSLGVDAQYGGRAMHINVGALGRAWFDKGITWEVSSLVIHELAHGIESNHLNVRYTQAVCDIAAKYAHLVAEQPDRFGALVPVGADR